MYSILFTNCGTNMLLCTWFCLMPKGDNEIHQMYYFYASCLPDVCLNIFTGMLCLLNSDLNLFFTCIILNCTQMTVIHLFHFASSCFLNLVNIQKMSKLQIPGNLFLSLLIFTDISIFPMAIWFYIFSGDSTRLLNKKK